MLLCASSSPWSICGSLRPYSWVSFSSSGLVLQLAVLPVDLWVSPTLFVGFLFYQWVCFIACELPVIAIAALVSSHPPGGFFSVAIYAGLLWGFGIISDFDLEKLIRLDIAVF